MDEELLCKLITRADMQQAVVASVATIKPPGSTTKSSKEVI
jgi:hypothetical protein